MVEPPFVFTHGYGFTLSRKMAGPDGLPPYFISDLGSATRIEQRRAWYQPGGC